MHENIRRTAHYVAITGLFLGCMAPFARAESKPIPVMTPVGAAPATNNPPPPATPQPAGTAPASTTAPAAAAAPSAPPAAPAGYDIRTTKELTGDWGGARKKLEDAGFSMKLAYQTQNMWNMRGGLETKNGIDTAGSYDLTFLFDISKMLKLPAGTEFFLRGKGTYGGETHDFDAEKIGGIFKTNADAGIEEPVFVDKWWLRQRFRIFRNNDLEFRAGRLVTLKDLFDTSELAGSEDERFLNSSLIGNPTIPHQAGLGVYANFWVREWLYIKGAVVDPESLPRQFGFDTAFHGTDRAKAFWEMGVRPQFETAKGKLTGTYRVGSWYDPGPRTKYFDDLGGLRAARIESDNLGIYFGFDQAVWKENDNAKDTQGLSVFARYGYAPGNRYRIEHFWSLGAQYTGLLPGRNKDILGLGFAQGILSEEYRNVVDGNAWQESVYEMYYAYELTPWCIITPDVQFIQNPGGGRDDDDATVAGIRIRVLF